MNNIVLTNNKDLRLVGMRVGVLSTLRIELPLIDAAATNVEVIITNAATHTAYLATYSASTHCWVCDVAAAQFPVTGKQSYEVAYLLGGKQFWDGKGWIEITEATTSGISPTPVPPPTRYVCVSVNGYTAQSVEGNIRIPKLFLTSGEPGGTDGYIEGDEIIDTETGYRWVLASITNALTWVQVAVNLSGYYTKAQTDAAINALAAYYITANAQGAAFATYAALANAETFYSGGEVRIPTRNDYAVVLEDETHGGAEYRYIYAVPTEGGAGHWEPQYPIETNEYTALQHKPQIGGVELVGDKTLAQLGIASAADATLTKRGPNHDGFTAWSFSDGESYTIKVFYEDAGGGYIDIPWVVGVQGAYGGNRYATEEAANYALANTLTQINFTIDEHSVSATRTAIPGYILGTQTDKPVASEDETESLREKKYEKPSGGIPAIDLAPGVQTSLGKADTALQSLTVLSYGTSTWADLQAALAKNAVVFCLASSNSNPATGTQSRRAFLAYLTDTEAEFQYYRSMNNHTYSQQNDQIFVYKLTSAGVWSVETRNANMKIVIDPSLNHSESTGTGAAMTISAPIAFPWFRSTATYSVGTRVVYSNAIWECTTAVSTPGNWTGAANWTKVFDLLTDATPTANSTRLMTSGAIKTATDLTARITFDEWVVTGAPSHYDISDMTVFWGDPDEYGTDVWNFSLPFGSGWVRTNNSDLNAVSLSYDGCTATRNVKHSFVLGSQTDKPLASAGALNGVAKLPAQFTDEDVRAKINEIIDAFTTSNGGN